MSESTIFNLEYILKYTFRVCHIFPVCMLSGKIVYDYLFSLPAD